MRNVQYRPWIAISMPLLLVQFASANTLVQSEFELKLPRGFQQRIIDKEWKTLQTQVFATQLPIADQSLHVQDTDVLVSGIHLDLQTQLAKPNVTTPGSSPRSAAGPSLALESRNMSAHLKIQSVSVDQIIVRTVGGVVGRFHLQARCENVDLQLKIGEGHFKTSLSPVLSGNKISSHVDSLDISWSPNAWTLAPMSCTGAEGFEEIVGQYVLSLTSNSATLTEHKAELIAAEQKYFDTKSVDLSKPSVLSSGRRDIQYSLRVVSVQGAQPLMVRGVLSVNFRNVAHQKDVYIPLSKATVKDYQADNPSAQLRVPEELLRVLLAKALTPYSWKARVASSLVPGFAALRASKLIECFLWPALKPYPEEAPFVFDVTTSQPMGLQGFDLNYTAKSELAVNMLAPSGDNGATEFIPFMNFKIPLESAIQVQLQHGTLSATLTGVSTVIEPLFADAYVKAYDPNQRFAADVLENRLMKSAEGMTLTYPLPAIQFLDGIAFHLDSVTTAPPGADLLFLLN